MKELVIYDEQNGGFLWVRSDRNCRQGSQIGWINGDGYRETKLMGGVSFKVHRLVWLWHTKTLPDDKIIDHINSNKLDNRIYNLREATPQESACNRRVTNKLNIKGVDMRSPGKYRALIRRDGKIIRLGQYSTAEEAHAAYCHAAKEIHGKFANNGIHNI